MLLRVWWEKPGSLFPFLIRVDSHAAGFALVGASPGHAPQGRDFYVHEFFLMRPFRGRGVAEDAVIGVFESLRGRWELRTWPSNVRAQAFWRKTLSHYTAGQFTEEVRHTMEDDAVKVVFSFANGPADQWAKDKGHPPHLCVQGLAAGRGGVSTMGVQVRPLGAEDYLAVAGIINLVEAPWQTNEDVTRQEDEDVTAAGGTVCHHVAIEDGQVVGHGVVRRGASSTHLPPYQLELRVHPDWRGRGIGHLLWQRLQEDLGGLLPTSVRAWVRERSPEGLTFAQRRGFAEVSRSGPWTLAVAEADISVNLTAVERATALGLVLTTLAAERERRPECLPALHRLRAAVDADIPAVEPYPVLSFDDFEREAESAWADGFLIARRGDEYVGLSCLRRSPIDSLELHQAITGVRADCRHQGVATALKARGVQLARERGYARIVTYVDSTNAPMAALNQKLGFVGGNDAVLMERRYGGA